MNGGRGKLVARFGGATILWKQHPIYGEHSIHEFEELYRDDRPGEGLDIPDSERSIDTFDAFLVIFIIACLFNAAVVLLIT